MGSAIEVGRDNFEETVKKDGILLLDWWAEWCGPCRGFAPVFEAAAAKHLDLTFGKIDTEAQQELAGAFEIRSIPTLMIFKDRVLVFSQPGALPAATLEELIEKVRALDMVKVKADLAAEGAAKPAP